MTSEEIYEINKTAKIFAKKFVEKNPTLSSLTKQQKKKLHYDLTSLLTGFGGLWIKQ